MKKHIPSLLVLSASASLLWGAAHAEPMIPPSLHEGPHHVHGALFPLPGVVLTDEQKNKIHAILEGNRSDHTASSLHDDAHHQLRDLLRSPGDVDHKTLKKLEKEVEKEDSDHLHKMVDVALALRSVLTPEQRQQAYVNENKIHDLEKQIDDITHPKDISTPSLPK